VLQEELAVVLGTKPACHAYGRWTGKAGIKTAGYQML